MVHAAQRRGTMYEERSSEWCMHSRRGTMYEERSSEWCMQSREEGSCKHEERSSEWESVNERGQVGQDGHRRQGRSWYHGCRTSEVRLDSFCKPVGVKKDTMSHEVKDLSMHRLKPALACPAAVIKQDLGHFNIPHSCNTYRAWWTAVVR